MIRPPKDAVSFVCPDCMEPGCYEVCMACFGKSGTYQRCFGLARSDDDHRHCSCDLNAAPATYLVLDHTDADRAYEAITTAIAQASRNERK